MRICGKTICCKPCCACPDKFGLCILPSPEELRTIAQGSSESQQPRKAER